MKYLAAIRKKQGLTQTDLAEKVGIGMNSIARYERGEVQPSVTLLLWASRIFARYRSSKVLHRGNLFGWLLALYFQLSVPRPFTAPTSCSFVNLLASRFAGSCATSLFISLSVSLSLDDDIISQKLNLTIGINTYM